MNAFSRLEGAFAAPIVLSRSGGILPGISFWLGGAMVYLHGAAVEPRKEADVFPEREEERELR